MVEILCDKEFIIFAGIVFIPGENIFENLKFC